MKTLFSVLVLFFIATSYASAYVCTDIPRSLVRTQESSQVRLVQNFLFEKGYLKATPNGYFGLGTFAAVKAYQRSIGLAQVGNVGPATRAAIKKETCSTSVVLPQAVPNTSPVYQQLTPQVTTPVQTPPAQVPQTLSLEDERNLRRKQDSENILKALYQRFSSTRGAHSVAVTDIPKELCAVDPSSLLATAATSTDGSFTYTTPVSPCLEYVDISYLVPGYMMTIPRDPTLPTTNALLGYTITRSEYNYITIAPKITDGGATVYAGCSFGDYCHNLKSVSGVIYSQPELLSMGASEVIQGVTYKTPVIITGKGFTQKNVVTIKSNYSLREYTLGQFTSAVLTSTTSTISLDPSVINQVLSCGNGCMEKPPLGDYSMYISNEGGVSNTRLFRIKGFAQSSVSAKATITVTPDTKSTKIASLSISTAIPTTIKSLTLTATSSSGNLPGKITNFSLKDTMTGVSYPGNGLTISLPSDYLGANQSKIYDVYADFDEVYVDDSGFISYGGVFTLGDFISSIEMDIPIKQFAFSVSH